MKNKTTQEQLIELYEQQIQDLVMMSKIELGDDVIAKIKELKSQINKQQTAVEWLYQNLFPKQLDGFSEEEWKKIDTAFEQAKEMEKEQHDETSIAWYLEGQARRSNNKKWSSFEDYWRQTYGGNK